MDTAKIAATIAMETAVEVLSLDWAELNDCCGWYVPDRNFVMIMEHDGEDAFFEHCIQHAGTVSSKGQSMAFGEIMRQLHNDKGGHTWGLTPQDLCDMGWVRFNIKTGVVTVYNGNPQGMSMLLLFLLPYAVDKLVIDTWEDQVTIDEPTPEQVDGVLRQLKEVYDG